MAFKFIPQEVKFFDMFDQQAAKINIAAETFKDLASKGKWDDEGITVMRDLEHECDSITHDIIDKLNRTFITPFDREDIHQLAHELDNVVDMLYTTSKRLRLYKLKTVNQDLIQFSELIVHSVNALGKGSTPCETIKTRRTCTTPALKSTRSRTRATSSGTRSSSSFSTTRKTP